MYMFIAQPDDPVDVKQDNVELASLLDLLQEHISHQQTGD